MSPKLITALAVFGMIASLPSQADAQRRSGAQRAQDQQMAQIPRCSTNLGTITIADGQSTYWRELQLSPPQSLLRVVIQRSGCFTLVERRSRPIPCSRPRPCGLRPMPMALSYAPCPRVCAFIPRASAKARGGKSWTITTTSAGSRTSASRRGPKQSTPVLLQKPCARRHLAAGYFLAVR